MAISLFFNHCLLQHDITLYFRAANLQPAFISRVSNAMVIQKAGHTVASSLLLKRQLQLLGKIMRSPVAHPLFDASFATSSFSPLTSFYVRRKGRPHKEWIPEVYKEGLKLAGSHVNLRRATSNKFFWNNF